MDEQLLIRLAQIAIRCVVAYYVYKDAIKHEVPNKNFWVAATFLFWPVVVVYLFYRQRAARTVDLSFEQKAQLEIDHKREEEKRRIAAERAEMEMERKHEMDNLLLLLDGYIIMLIEILIHMKLQIFII